MLDNLESIRKEFNNKDLIIPDFQNFIVIQEALGGNMAICQKFIENFGNEGGFGDFVCKLSKLMSNYISSEDEDSAEWDGAGLKELIYSALNNKLWYYLHRESEDLVYSVEGTDDFEELKNTKNILYKLLKEFLEVLQDIKDLYYDVITSEQYVEVYSKYFAPILFSEEKLEIYTNIVQTLSGLIHTNKNDWEIASQLILEGIRSEVNEIPYGYLYDKGDAWRGQLLMLIRSVITDDYLTDMLIKCNYFELSMVAGEGDYDICGNTQAIQRLFQSLNEERVLKCLLRALEDTEDSKSIIKLTMRLTTYLPVIPDYLYSKYRYEIVKILKQVFEHNREYTTEVSNNNYYYYSEYYSNPDNIINISRYYNFDQATAPVIEVVEEIIKYINNAEDFIYILDTYFHGRDIKGEEFSILDAFCYLVNLVPTELLNDIITNNMPITLQAYWMEYNLGIR